MISLANPEAIEAAAEAIAAGLRTKSIADLARDALRAAAPHMAAGGWDEGYQAGVREEQPGWTKNPYR